MTQTRLIIYAWGIALLAALALTLTGCATADAQSTPDLPPTEQTDDETGQPVSSLPNVSDAPQESSDETLLPQFMLVDEDGNFVAGQQMSSCWPQAEGPALCIDTLPPTFEPDNVVEVGSQITVYIEAEVLPDSVYLSVVPSDSDDPFTSLAGEEIQNPEQQFTWEPDAPSGDMVLLISGSWIDVGDTSNAFSIRIQ